MATKEQLDYISGKRYEAQKNINRFKGNQHTRKSGEPDDLGHHGKNATALARAKEEGVSHSTIDQNRKFAIGIDALKEVAPALAETILKPKPDEPKLSKRKRTSTIRQIELVWLHKERICRPTHST